MVARAWPKITMTTLEKEPQACQTCAQEPGKRRGAGLNPWGPRLSRGKDREPLAYRRASQTWAMLIKRVYEIDPLCCPECGGQMKVVAFIEPPQGDVIEKILRHCGLWHASAGATGRRRLGPRPGRRCRAPDGRSASDEPRELTFVDMDTFEAAF